MKTWKTLKDTKWNEYNMKIAVKTINKMRNQIMHKWKGTGFAVGTLGPGGRGTRAPPQTPPPPPYPFICVYDFILYLSMFIFIFIFFIFHFIFIFHYVHFSFYFIFIILKKNHHIIAFHDLIDFVICFFINKTCSLLTWLASGGKKSIHFDFGVTFDDNSNEIVF